ncbi:MAG: hypothetical protein ABII72_00640 [Parcubacteria group bacterium]
MNTNLDLNLAEQFNAWATMTGKTLQEAQERAPELPEAKDLYAAFLELARPQEGDAGAVATRRLTCGACAAALGRVAGYQLGDASRAAAWFQAVANSFQAEAASNPRAAAISGTWAREAQELRGE